MSETRTTKVCPERGSTSMIKLESLNIKKCHKGHIVDWPLTEGQIPLNGSSRQRKASNKHLDWEIR